MIEILRTNDLVLISAVEAILRDIDAPFFVADSHMSALEGSIGMLPRRILVADDHFSRARRLLCEAGFAAELREP